MSETLSISLANLLIDVENPRLPQPNVGQREALRALAHHQQRKLLTLATDITHNGVNPADLPIVMPMGDDLNRWVVLEGNRRLAALRGLEHPDLFVDAIEAGTLDELRKLSKEYQKDPIEAVQCLAVKDRDEARHWIVLRHTGENEGAGIVRWGSAVSSVTVEQKLRLKLNACITHLLSRQKLTREQAAPVRRALEKDSFLAPSVNTMNGYVHNRNIFPGPTDLRNS